MSDHTDDPDLLAGAYALGVLERPEAAAFEAAMAADPRLQASLADWDDRLAPLAAIVPPVAPPPELWSRIVARAGLGVMARPRTSLARRTWRSTPFWRGTTVAALAIAAAFAALAFLREPSPAERLVAALAPPGAPAAVFMAEVQQDGRVLIRPLGPVAVQSGKDLELWALPAGATRPVSLGVLPPIGRNLPPRQLLASNTQLMISLEPQGGSPTGAPTGPVLWGGRLAPVD